LQRPILGGENIGPAGERSIRLDDTDDPGLVVVDVEHISHHDLPRGAVGIGESVAEAFDRKVVDDDGVRETQILEAAGDESFGSRSAGEGVVVEPDELDQLEIAVREAALDISDEDRCRPGGR